MLEGRKYILKENSGIIFGVDKYPELRMNPDDEYISDGGYCVAMQVHLNDAEVDPVICMDQEAAKELEKMLKKTRRALRKKKRRFF